MNKNNYQLQQRNREKLKSRVFEGFKTIVCPPCFGLIPIAALAIFYYVALDNRMVVFDTSTLPEQIVRIVDYIEIAAITIVFLVFAFTVLVFFGTPRKWRSAENSVMRVFGLESTPEEIPILVSSKKMKNGTRQWTFLSASIPIKLWQDTDNIDSICHRLKCHVVVQAEQDRNNCQRVLFYTKPGAIPSTRGELRDNEF